MWLENNPERIGARLWSKSMKNQAKSSQIGASFANDLLRKSISENHGFSKSDGVRESELEVFPSKFYR